MEQLLPSPVAQPSGNSPEDHLRKKPGREVVTDLAIIVENGLLETGGRLLPTPEAKLATSGPDYARTGREKSGGHDLATATHLMTKMHHTEPAQSWGPYASAVEQWERILRSFAPAPVEEGPKGGKRLASAFVEWMMGLPAGWVTGHGLARTAELKMLGNGVVPQQAVAALEAMR